jgi:hypothetical protein
VTVAKPEAKPGEHRLTFTLSDPANQETRDVSAVFVAGDGQ